MKTRKFKKGDVLRLKGQNTVRKEHKLKTWPESFNAIRDGRKTFDVRYNDRDFHVGDVLILREFKPHKRCNGSGWLEGMLYKMPCRCKKLHGKYTGRTVEAIVAFVYKGSLRFGILNGYVVLGIKDACEVSTKRKSK